MITIGLARRAVALRTIAAGCKRLGVAALALVIFQGVLGGMRVLLDERTLAHAARLHRARCSSRSPWRWSCSPRAHGTARRRIESQAGSAGSIRRLAAVTAVLAYLQIVLGAVLRHVPRRCRSPATFMHGREIPPVPGGRAHASHLCCSPALVLTRARGIRPLGRLGAGAGRLVVVQLALGAGTWIVKFAVPAWAAVGSRHAAVAIQDGGWLQTHIITAHVAIGSLILATSVAHRAVRPAAAGRRRRRRGRSSRARIGGRRMSRVTTTAGVVARPSARSRAAAGSRASAITSSSPSRGSSMLELVTVDRRRPSGVAVGHSTRGVLLHTVLGAALVAASAGAFNQWWEQATDARMTRTANRPLPAGRLTRAASRRLRRRYAGRRRWSNWLSGVNRADGRASRSRPGWSTCWPTRR